MSLILVLRLKNKVNIMLTEEKVHRKTRYSVVFYIICHLLYQLADVENLENTIILHLMTHVNLTERYKS